MTMVPAGDEQVLTDTLVEAIEGVDGRNGGQLLQPETGPAAKPWNFLDRFGIESEVPSQPVTAGPAASFWRN